MHDDEKQKNYELAEKLISEQNFAAAVIAGTIAMLLAAVAYGIVSKDGQLLMASRQPVLGP